LPIEFIATLNAKFLTRLEFEFTPEQRQKILGELKLNENAPGAAEFLMQSQRAIGTYQILKSNAEAKTTLKETLTRLRTLRKQVDKLLKSLTDPDPEVEHLLRLAFQDPTQGVSVRIPPEPCTPLAELSERLTQLRNLLDDEIARLPPHIQRGRATDYMLHRAVYQIAEAYRHAFGHLPPSTRESAFENALVATLETGGIVRADLHKYIHHALVQAKGQKLAPT